MSETRTYGGDGYLASVDPDQSIELTLGDELLTVQRQRLGGHLRLMGIDRDLVSCVLAGDVAGAARVIRLYVEVAGLETRDLRSGEVFLAYRLLRALNALRWDYAFMSVSGKSDDALTRPYEYLDRVYALMVHDVASRYGWTSREIFDLWPEEFLAYVQEIMISRYDELDQQRQLSRMCYKEDRAGKRLIWHPLSRPDWMIRMDRPRSRRVPKRLLPQGETINLSTLQPEPERAATSS